MQKKLKLIHTLKEFTVYLEDIRGSGTLNKLTRLIKINMCLKSVYYFALVILLFFKTRTNNNTYSFTFRYIDYEKKNYKIDLKEEKNIL